MDEQRLFTLLEKVLETNARVIEQNDRFLEFLKTRDDRIPERTVLEIERLKLDIERGKAHQESRVADLASLAKLGTSPMEIFENEIADRIERSAEQKEWRLTSSTKKRQELRDKIDALKAAEPPALSEPAKTGT